MTADMLRLAYRAAEWSPDTSTKNGAVIVLDEWVEPLVGACNGMPPGVACTPERLERPAKYAYTEHAERASILAAHRQGVSVQGATLYCCWAACADCARAIIGSGIRRLVRHKILQHAERPDWAESIRVGDEMMREAGVEIVEYDQLLGVAAFFCGKAILV